MTMTRFRSASARRLLLTASLLALATAQAAAVEPRIGGGFGSPDGGPAQTAGARRLDLSVGRSIIIDLPRDAKEVFVANPAIANAVVRSARKIFMIGVSNGVTSVFIMDAEGRQISSLEVNVGRDLSVLRQTIQTAIPSARIEVRSAGDSILLTGSVAAAGDAQQAVDIAKAFVGQTSASSSVGGAAVGGVNVSSTTTGTVINSISIKGRDQVMLKVTIVEMARTALKQLGVNMAGNWNILSNTSLGALNPFGPSFTAGSGTGIVGVLSGTGGALTGQFAPNASSTVGGTISALERAGVSRVLAEPTLVAISGESATFLAGGEIPIVINSCAAGSGTTSQICTPTVTYKAYGVSLAFTPIVLAEGRISLRVATEVSEIDRDNQDVLTRSPGFRTRKTSTSIELPSGASMVTAGLISAQSNQAISGVPGLINLPILGTLFRSRDFQRRDSELMIMVTPYIAKPMESAQVVRPDDGFVEASDPQGVLLGRLNKLYGTAGPGPGKGYSGRVGFITD